MLNEPTLEKLQALRLGAFAEAWREQQKNPEIASLVFDERLPSPNFPASKDFFRKSRI